MQFYSGLAGMLQLQITVHLLPIEELQTKPLKSIKIINNYAQWQIYNDDIQTSLCGSN